MRASTLRGLVFLAVLGAVNSFAIHQDGQASYISSLIPNKNATSFSRMCCCHPFQRFTARQHNNSLIPLNLFADAGGKQLSWQSRLPLARPHERAIFLFYFFLGMGLTYLGKLSRISQSKLESGLTLIWLGMVLGVSFLEAWVKFKAPFLRKHVAVDVGRHVFAALNAAELALAGSFWCARAVLKANSISAYLPVIATTTLLVQAFWISPLLFLRAKDKIVKGFEGAVDVLVDSEKEQLETLSKEVTEVTMPSPRYHFVYTLLEMVKAVCLGTFAFVR